MDTLLSLLLASIGITIPFMIPQLQMFGLKSIFFYTPLFWFLGAVLVHKTMKLFSFDLLSFALIVFHSIYFVVLPIYTAVTAHYQTWLSLVWTVDHIGMIALIFTFHFLRGERNRQTLFLLIFIPPIVETYWHYYTETVTSKKKFDMKILTLVWFVFFVSWLLLFAFSGSENFIGNVWEQFLANEKVLSKINPVWTEFSFHLVVALMIAIDIFLHAARYCEVLDHEEKRWKRWLSFFFITYILMCHVTTGVFVAMVITIHF